VKDSRGSNSPCRALGRLGLALEGPMGLGVLCMSLEKAHLSSGRSEMDLEGPIEPRKAL